MSAVRLHVNDDLAAGRMIGLAREQSHYLGHVLRLGRGDEIRLFNGRDGEWRGAIEAVGRGWCSIALSECLRAQPAESDLWLVFAPVKRARIDFIASKATELGVSRLVPVFTRHTAVERVNVARLHANAIEAAEQCGRLNVPDVAEAQPLDGLLAGWPAGRRLLLCDESGAGEPVAEALIRLRVAPDAVSAPWAVLVGPEGGFASGELDLLRKTTIVTPVTLGPRILRADTAAVAVLACWQALVGDWRREDAPPASG